MNRSLFAKRKSRVGEVYRGVTKYIDKETKLERNYVVLKDKDDRVTVAKLKSIKKFDENGKNADIALVEINSSRYGLEKRTGVDFQRFDRNLMTKKSLDIKDKKVFPEKTPRFILSNKDRDKALFHTGIRKRLKKRSNK